VTAAIDTGTVPPRPLDCAGVPSDCRDAAPDEQPAVKTPASDAAMAKVDADLTSGNLDERVDRIMRKVRQVSRDPR
jgi:hypothetical protein